MIQVIGKSGMLGSQVVRVASQLGIEVYDEFVDTVSVRPDEIKCDVVINCSGISPTESKSKMVSVNRFGPKNLAAACDAVGSRLIHISTDAVFGGPGPHSERSMYSPSTSYGRIKMLGEIRYYPHLTVRTSFVGFGRRGIVEQLVSTNERINASSKFLWSGNTAYTVAKIIVDLSLNKNIYGVIHIPGEFQSRLDLVCRLADLFGVSRDRIVQDDSYITDHRLISSRWSILGLPDVPAFEEQLHDLSDQYSSSCRSKKAS